MFQVGENVVYKKDVCLIKEIKKSRFNGQDYYVLLPIDDPSLTIEIPVENRSQQLRMLIDAETIEQMIQKIPEIPIIDCEDRLLESEYKALLSTGKHEDLVKIIKTTYLRNKARLDNKKKIGDRDDFYFQKAENYLYTECAVVLGKNREDMQAYIMDKVKSLEK